MYYGTIKPFDIANGPGVRVSLFVSGCRNHCKGCFQPETWDFRYGKEFTYETMQEIHRLLEDPNITGLSILGGDPLEPENIGTVAEICKKVKETFGGTRDIWLWTGYDFIDYIDHELMSYLDVVVDGKYEADKRDLRLSYRGSWNQRVINVPKSIGARCAIRLEGDWR